MIAAVPKPKSEREITEEFVTLMSPRFELWPQVSMKHALGGSCKRIDFVGRERAGNYQGFIGFELKRGQYDNFRCFTLAVKQAMDYMHCAIQSDFIDVKDVFSRRLRHAFVFPCPFFVHDSDNDIDWKAKGVTHLAGRYGVGVIEKRNGYQRGYELILAGHTVYEISTGNARKLAAIHTASERFGSQ